MAAAGSPARNEAQTGRLAELADDVGRMHLQTVDSSAAPVISSGANRIAPFQLPASSTASLANMVETASLHEADKSTAEEDKLVVDEDMARADSDAVTSADDVASRTDSVSVTDEACPAPNSTCMRFSEHLICSYTVYAHCALLGCGGAMGAVYSLELTPGL